jgi:hypothetical protein
MSLLRDIQNDATSNEIPVTVLLRRCMVLATRLQHEPLKEWTKREMNGYPEEVALPPYRPKIQTEVLGDFAGYGGSSMSNKSLPSANVPEQFRDWLFSTEVRQGVAQIEGLVTSGESRFQIPWPADVIAILQDKFIQNMALMNAHQVVPAAVFEGALSGIRDRIVQFALEIEELDPAAGEAEPGHAPIDQGRVTQIFNQTFHGDNTAFAAAGANVNQTQQITVNLDVVRETADAFGISPEDRDRLLGAIEADGGMPGENTGGWLDQLKAGTIEVGAGVATGTAVAALSGVLGLA